MNPTPTVQQIISKLNQPPSASTAPAVWPAVTREYATFRAEVTAGMAADVDAANAFWTELRRVFEHGWDFLAERQRFQAQADALRAGLTNVMRLLATLWTQNFAELDGVEDGLGADAALWSSLAGRVSQIRMNALKLRELNGWEGPAASSYAAAVDVQAGALVELNLSLRALSESCDSGLVSNSSILTVVENTFLPASETVRRTSPTDGNRYYLKTAAALSVAQPILRSMSDALKEAGRLSEELVAYVDAALEAPNYLDPGVAWISGTAAAGTAPGDFPSSSNAPGISAPSTRTSSSSVPGVDL